MEPRNDPSSPAGPTGGGWSQGDYPGAASPGGAGPQPQGPPPTAGGGSPPMMPPPGGGYVPPMPPPPGAPKRTNTTAIVAVVAVVVAIAVVVAVALVTRRSDEQVSPTTTAVTALAGSVASLDDVQRAVVRIETEGSFVDPAEGEVIAGGSGSGFFVDPSGVIVTNNHVVTGAGMVRVFVDGRTDPLVGQIRGVSECSDLAVVTVEGSNFPFLAWHDEEVRAGLDVYAAGFPLGDPEFTLNRGVVAKARANGNTESSAIDHVLEHDAQLQPGNSGGPLVDAQGRVVAVNYYGAGAPAGIQFRAIAGDIAKPIVETLREGTDVDSIGVNGEAIVDEENRVAGVFVGGVAAGSPAANAGVEGGDLITRLNGLPLAEDGTMAAYCGAIRSAGQDQPMSIEVVRIATGEVLRGELNNPNKPLAPAFSFADQLGDDVPSTTTPTPGPTAPPSETYVPVSDDSGTLTLEVPTSWSQVDGAPQTVNGVSVPSVVASPDIERFRQTYDTPGVDFLATDQLARAQIPELLDTLGQAVAPGCSGPDRQEYDDGLYTGFYDRWSNCGASGAEVVVIGAAPEDDAFVALVTVQAISQADLEALDRIIQTFKVTP